MISYDNALDFLYNQRPAFERHGAGGYKPGLETTSSLACEYDNPHESIKTIHVAGTNGKGSVSHLLAAVLQKQGYKVGLYTSPHFVDFTERIKVNGIPISHERVCSFVDDYKSRAFKVTPTFFEIITILAFQYFKECKVDFAIIEVGLGGRLDSTNIIKPIFSVITSISLDHTEFLGNTIAEVAREKAGIIKPGVPVVVGEVNTEAFEVIKSQAKKLNAPFFSVNNSHEIYSIANRGEFVEYTTRSYGDLKCQLVGDYQQHNVLTVLTALDYLKEHIDIDNESIAMGFANVCDITGFRGRWTIINHEPLVICDSAHNPDGIKHVMSQLTSISCKRLRMVIGFMKDKDVEQILTLLPQDAQYYFTSANTMRAMKAGDLQSLAQQHGLDGESFPNVVEAYTNALNDASVDDMIYVGGSMYVLSDFFEYIDK